MINLKRFLTVLQVTSSDLFTEISQLASSSSAGDFRSSHTSKARGCPLQVGRGSAAAAGASEPTWNGTISEQKVPTFTFTSTNPFNIERVLRSLSCNCCFNLTKTCEFDETFSLMINNMFIEFFILRRNNEKKKSHIFIRSCSFQQTVSKNAEKQTASRPCWPSRSWSCLTEAAAKLKTNKNVFRGHNAVMAAQRVMPSGSQ